MELRGYFTLVRKWIWLVILCAVLAGLAAFLISRRQVPIYQATSTVLINQARSATGDTTYQDILTSERIARTYAQLLQDYPTLDRAVAEMGLGDTFKAMQDIFAIDVTVTPVRDTQLVGLTVESNNADIAARLANTLPQVFSSMNQAQQSQRYAETRGQLQEELATVDADIASNQAALEAVSADDPGNAAEIARLESVMRRLEASSTTMLSSLEELRLAEVQSRDDIVLVTPAQVPTDPIRPRVLYNTLLAAMVGAMLGLGAAFLLEYLDDTVKTPEDVRQVTGLTTLGGVVKLPGDTRAEQLVTQIAPKSPGAEAYRVLRTNLQFSALDKPLATLISTSAGPGEGKSTTAANLAVSMAQGDKRVLLIDADMRRPVQHKLFKLANNVGLSTALLDKEHDPDVYLQATAVPNLRVMTTGPIPPNPAEMLNSTRMHELIERLKDAADVVIFDTPPVLAVADALILAGQVDGTLLVVGVGETRAEMLAQAMQRLESVGILPLGAVLNKITERQSGYYYYYYYHYASRYGDAEDKDGNGDKPAGGRRRRSAGRRKAEQTT